MKITTLLTSLALVATATATTAAVADWRKEAAADAAAGLDVADQTLTNVQNLIARGHRSIPAAMDAGGTYWNAAVAVSVNDWERARSEVDLAGDKVTRGQLEGLVLRAQSQYDVVKGFLETSVAINAASANSGNLDRLSNVVQLQAVLGLAQARLYEARTRLANFVEVNG